MFTVPCKCREPIQVLEIDLNHPLKCAACGAEVTCVCAEPIETAAAQADFAAALLVLAGPEKVGQVFRLGGRAPIDVGKHPASHLQLIGNQVSRAHCRLVRLNDDPPRWRIEDKKSTNGLFVNDEHVSGRDLSNGDLIGIGEYKLRLYIPKPT